MKKTQQTPWKRLGLQMSVMVLFLVAVLVILSTALSAGHEANAVALTRESTPVPTQEAVVVQERNYGAWAYKATRDRELYAKVDYDASSVPALQAYAEANRTLVSHLAQETGQVEIQITFRRYLSAAEYRIWIANYPSINVEVTGVRFVDTSGLRAGLGVIPEADDLLPEAMLENEHLATLSGVMSMKGSIDAHDLPQLANDTLVFLLDCTRAEVKRDLRAAGVPDADQADVNVRSPFWEMENLGLEYFR